MNRPPVPVGEEFEYDAASGAVIVPEGADLRLAWFDDVGWKPLANRPPGTVGGDWLVWMMYDAYLDAALVVRAELRRHYDGGPDAVFVEESE